MVWKTHNRTKIWTEISRNSIPQAGQQAKINQVNGGWWCLKGEICEIAHGKSENVINKVFDNPMIEVFLRNLLIN